MGKTTQVRVFVAFLSAASLAVPAFAQGPTPVAKSAAAPLSRIHIGNFGKINDNYFRGAQPRGNDYRDLAAIGVKTVIDRQIDGPSDEAGIVKSNGMKFYRIGMTTSQAPTRAQVEQFFKIVNDPASQPVFVHCAGGRHRTGTMTALYRITNDGWTSAQAYNEMKAFHFEGFPGHPVLKSYVMNYSVPAKTPPTVLATDIITTK